MILGIFAQQDFLPSLLPGCVLWIRASEGVSKTGDSITAIADQSGQGNDITVTGVGNPQYVASAINGLPGIQITGGLMQGSTRLLGLAMSALHGLVLLGDSYIKMTLADVVIPFIGPYEPLGVGLGVVGFYLMFLLSSSFYARKWLGQKTFRRLHYASYPTYLLVTWHSLGAGTDSSLLWPLYAASLGAVVLLTVWRVAKARQTLM